jgi:serine/threonine protein phosphatase PrpC
VSLGRFTFVHALACPREPGEDRLAVIDRDGALVVVVADGAGGLVGGGRAATLVVATVREAAGSPGFAPHRPEAWVEVLAHADLALEADPAAGETTAVVVAVAVDLLVGASSGDSGAWVVRPGGRIDDLTARQHRRPRLGSGGALPVSFARPALAGTLIVATDGLLAYARPERVTAAALAEDLDGAARALVQLVRLPGGGLQDDVGLILVRELTRVGSSDANG